MTGNEPASEMTIRQAFAMAAIMGLCANPDCSEQSEGIIAKWSVVQADALIAELNNREAEESE